jgi:hypothetical protein
MKRIYLFVVFSMLLLNSAVFAQDIIMKKNNELIKCKIKEIGLDEVKYHPSGVF